MSNPFDYFWKQDPLKAADDLIKHSNFNPTGHDKDFPINVSLLLLASVFVALTKSLYGVSGYTLTQHFVTSLILIFVGYIVIGIAGIAFLPKQTATTDRYQWISNRLRCLLTCLIASLTVSLFLVWFSEPITEWGVDVVDFLHLPNILADRIADATPAIVFSALGCAAIYRLQLRAVETKLTTLFWFVGYWAATCGILYFLAFDRRSFFDEIMNHMSNVKLF